ncbi:MAG: hypothetical protein A2328_02350 [Bdellovibrionales bacterium RIFOXYB2_FULL_36_6]|nr:MAG: hypothetical protein A2328_02350 [Bdellovibrionales bacterium RIFOXYB2_FULL_36_6]
MQTQLPFFPASVKHINPHVGVYRQDDFVYYMHNGSPLFCHATNDRNSYRYITANLVEINLCSPSEIARVFGVSARSIQLNAKALREKGPGWFFNREETRGKCYKFTQESFEEAQKMLDEGKTKSEIGRQLGVSESAVGYHIKQGKLKKNPFRKE